MWKVYFSGTEIKAYKKLCADLQSIVDLLVADLEVSGPVRGNWRNYGKLSENEHHCHIKTGKPTYVVCWRVLNKQSKEIEVYYVGTHEKAPY